MTTTESASVARGRLLTRSVLARGVISGVVAWLAGYLVAYVARADAVAETLRGVGFVSELLGGTAVPTWKGVAWLFGNAHFVDVRFPTPFGGTQSVNILTGDGTAALLVVPALVLAVAGALAAVARAGDLTERATAGAAVALGYLPAWVLTVALGTHAVGDTEAAIALDPVTGILVAGVVYPVVSGALGGAVTTKLI